jgi:hypothetical protein
MGCKNGRGKEERKMKRWTHKQDKWGKIDAFVGRWGFVSVIVAAIILILIVMLLGAK